MIDAIPVGDLRPIFLVGAGAALGAALRHWVSVAIASNRFPWSTLLVNVLGSFALGLLAFGGASETAMSVFGVGCCGAFTTFSTFAVETVELVERGDRAAAIVSAAGNLACALAGLGVAAALVG